MQGCLGYALSAGVEGYASVSKQLKGWEGDGDESVVCHSNMIYVCPSHLKASMIDADPIAPLAFLIATSLPR